MYFKIKMILLAIFSINLFANDLEIEKIFKNKEVEGTMVIESLNQNKSYIYNKQRAETFLSPASSFKIPHTLIALNEGLVTVDSVINWDKNIGLVKSCNANQTLKSSFKNSCIWVYQVFASTIDSSKYKNYLEQMDYGNKVVGNDVKNFWLDESLKINAFEQINFLKKLHKNNLPFKQKDIDALKNIIIDEKQKAVNWLSLVFCKLNNITPEQDRIKIAKSCVSGVASALLPKNSILDKRDDKGRPPASHPSKLYKTRKISSL